MKQLLRYFIVVLISTGVISCEEKEMRFVAPAPQIVALIEGSNRFVQEPGKDVFLSFNLQAASGLEAFNILLNDQVFEEITYTNEFTSSYDFTFTVPLDSNPDDVFAFSFQLTDSELRTVSYEFVVVSGLPYSIEEFEFEGSTVVRVKGRLNGNFNFTADKKYLLDSIVSLEDNGVLTIDPGTTVYFQSSANPAFTSSLFITPGSRINANGTKDAPIVFTSDKLLFGGTPAPQDWGGIFLYGRAPSNQGSVVLEEGFRYGGTQTSDNSGTLRYVRIEYSGKSEQHALHLFGTGSGTIIENVQVYRSYNIAFRVKGGNVNLRRIAAIGYGAYGIWAEHGWRGNGQFWVFQTDVKVTLVPVNYWNQARAVEMRNDENFFDLAPRTNFRISNVTATGNGYEANGDFGTRRGVRFRRGAIGILQNSIFMQFPDDGARVEDLPISDLGTNLVMDNLRVYSNRVNFGQEALTFFFQSGNYNITENPVSGISTTNYVGAVVSSFNPTSLGSWFESAPFIGAIQNESTDWTADGTWFRNIDGSIR